MLITKRSINLQTLLFSILLILGEISFASEVVPQDGFIESKDLKATIDAYMFREVISVFDEIKNEHESGSSKAVLDRYRQTLSDFRAQNEFYIAVSAKATSCNSIVSIKTRISCLQKIGTSPLREKAKLQKMEAEYKNAQGRLVETTNSIVASHNKRLSNLFYLRGYGNFDVFRGNWNGLKSPIADGEPCMNDLQITSLDSETLEARGLCVNSLSSIFGFVISPPKDIKLLNINRVEDLYAMLISLTNWDNANPNTKAGTEERGRIISETREKYCLDKGNVPGCTYDYRYLESLSGAQYEFARRFGLSEIVRLWPE